MDEHHIKKIRRGYWSNSKVPLHAISEEAFHVWKDDHTLSKLSKLFGSIIVGSGRAHV